MYNIVYFYVNVYNVLVYNLNLTLIVQCKLTNLRKKVKKKKVWRWVYCPWKVEKGVHQTAQTAKPTPKPLANGITAPHRK